MIEPESINDYTQVATELSERALLQVWSSLGDYREHLVLVGGLVPRYLIDQSKVQISERHCGTIDVDLGISLAVRKLETYQGIAETLSKLGFKPGKNAKGNDKKHSFINQINGHTVIIDFLTVQYHGKKNPTMRGLEENLSAIKTEGLGLAFESPLEVEIKGELFSGGLREETIKVCRPIPFIVLKALACDKRIKNKDAYDLTYILKYYDGGIQRLVSEITSKERKALSFQNAIQALQKHFKTPAHNGPVRYANFLNDEAQAIQSFAAVQEFLENLT